MFAGMAFAARKAQGGTIMKRLLCALVSALVTLSVVGGPAAAADRSIGEKLDDTKITAAVKTKLAADRLKSLVAVGVETNELRVEASDTSPSASPK